ncbi:M48 family metallopeptidase [Opitutus sp. GAS368]|uniref:M48 family metallopeptidase n=1 Tax=Opitutus sp. GAS368 TaxID=1882749 RepID=UPI00087D9073|nr:M48 family metallopeptidase [Opitutus sp. GAS368]SDR78554.1 Zn-dependent protease with chaperone function [Opitutus sp. GAS368]
MDFFEAQEHARKRTHRLVFLFVFAVLGTILAGYAAAWFLLGSVGSYQGYGRRIYREEVSSSRPLFDPKLLLAVAGGTVAVVSLASLYKWSQMREGGAAIAELAGGRPLDPKTTDLRERKLLNVVEEMAIASGIPMPAVYVLEDEPGLNAFAAGFTTSDAAVTVTRGALDKLTRDELQGVIGHEFSHILNGDMRLNVRITAIVFGILVIGLLGRGLLQSLGRGRVSGGDGKKGGGIAGLLVVGLALMIIGYVGYFFGRLIQAAVSRQREFLADASAVQFTRNPGGITGALKKIGGYAIGGNVIGGNTAEISHFFFAQAFQSNFGGLWATHPPLDERIRAVDPSWDGKLFEPEQVVDIAHESSAIAGFGGGQRFSAAETLERVQAAPADLPPVLPVKPIAFKPVKIVANLGALTEAHFRHAQQLLDNIPARLRESTRDPVAAQVLVYGLLLSGDKAARDLQQELVAKHAGPEAAAALAAQRPALSLLDAEARLPLLQLALPALRSLDATALDRFFTTLDELVHADGKVTPFEYAMQKLLLSQLQLAQKPVRRVQFDSFDAVKGEIGVVLSALAYFSPKDSAGAFAEGAGQMPVIRDQLTLLAPAACGLEQVDAALDKLAVSSMPIKQRLLVAAGHVIASDGTVTVEEGELYRAFAATLDCPMPALGQTI